ncbi:MAG: acyl-CoA dehydrogenase family protein [Candidatus Omnitrophica bacterium]|nr:acyl-CoA dehydrogenase family protein [Candidatus Omnitrophota bacterium]
MNFSWSKNQEELKRAATKFAAAKLNDDIIQRDKNGKFSLDGWKACADFGLQGMLMPKKYGGLGFGLLDIVAILEGIGYGCKDNGLIFSINAHIWGAEAPIYHFGTETQKKKLLPGFCNGSLIGANAMTEPGSGSDVYSLRTTAVKKNNYYTLNGTKIFVTNAPLADIFIVYARTAKSRGFSGLSCFLVEKGTKGLVIGENFEKMGLRTSPMSEVIFNNCKIPKNNLVGQKGSGALVFNDSMEWERVFILANCVGIMDRQLKYCIEYANSRKLDTKPIGKYQSVANKIVDIQSNLEVSRLLLHKAAWLKSCKESASMASAMTKLYLSEAYIKSIRCVMDIFGGYGYMTEYELERELRDALASTAYSGTSQIQKNIIAGLSGL